MGPSYDVNDVAAQPSKLRNTTPSTRAAKLRRRHGRQQRLDQ